LTDIIITLVKSDKTKKHIRTFNHIDFIPAVDDPLVMMTETGMNFYVVVQRKFVFNYIKSTLETIFVLVRKATKSERNGC